MEISLYIYPCNLRNFIYGASDGRIVGIFDGIMMVGMSDGVWDGILPGRLNGRIVGCSTVEKTSHL